MVVVLIAGGCLRTTTFQCGDSSQCVANGLQGTCEPNSFCAFPDGNCVSGLRYGGLSGAVAGQCVDGPQQSVQITVGGTVVSLTGHGLVLRDNGADDLSVAMAGAFVFASPITTGDPYAVTVGAQPSNPSQMCAVANGNGVAATADITDVTVSCSTATYTIGGNVLGLTTTGLVLTDGAEDLPVSASGPFTFTLPVASGAMYTVSVKTQPSGQSCAVLGGTGTVGTGDVTTVVVNCSSSAFIISGMVGGLDGTVVLHDATAGTASVNANGSWALPMLVPASTAYNVTVQTQPAYPPAAQTCVVANGSGTATMNVTDVAVTCTTNKYTVGGNVSGLTGTLVLQDNGGDDKTITASGGFTFATPIASGNPYAVTIKTQPSGQTCTLAMASGTVTNANITTVAVTCGAGGDPGILCGTTYCDPSVDLCCVNGGTYTCEPSCTTGVPYRCDDQADCAAQGQPNNVCCGSVSGTTINSIFCTKTSNCGTASKPVFCDPAAPNNCPLGGTCMAAPQPAGYYWCM